MFLSILDSFFEDILLQGAKHRKNEDLNPVKNNGFRRCFKA
jgi:hypothetical protein